MKRQFLASLLAGLLAATAAGSMALAQTTPSKSVPANPVKPAAKTDGTVAATTADPKEVTIEADSLEVMEDKNQAFFQGKVKSLRKGTTLDSDDLLVTYADTPTGTDKATGKATKKTDVTFLDAKGNILIVTKNEKITGDWFKMDVTADILTVGGELVTLVTKDSTLRGKLLVINRKKNTTTMTGSRVTGNFSSGK